MPTKLNHNQEIVRNVSELPLQEIPLVLEMVLKHLNLVVVRESGYGGTEFSLHLEGSVEGYDWTRN